MNEAKPALAPIKHNVETYRAAGLEARWTKTPHGRPVIVCRDPNSRRPHQRDRWWCITRAIWERAAIVGVREAFDEGTLLGDIFSVNL